MSLATASAVSTTSIIVLRVPGSVDPRRLSATLAFPHKQVDETLARLSARPEGSIATVQLGSLMPEAAARSWLFEGELRSDEVMAADLVFNVERFAVPFFQQNRDLRNLSESVARNSDEDSRAYLAPVLHYLLDQRELAEQSVDEELANDQSTAGSEYREFATRFVDLLRADR